MKRLATTCVEYNADIKAVDDATSTHEWQMYIDGSNGMRTNFIRRGVESDHFAMFTADRNPYND